MPGSLKAHLEKAGLHRWQGEQGELPPVSTLVVYPSPDLALTASLEDLESPPELSHLLEGYRHVHRLTSSYPVMAAWRLEALSPAAIAEWLNGQALPSLDRSFPSPEPDHATFVSSVLTANPKLVQVFLDVELNAELAKGQPDVEYQQRLRRAAANSQQALATWWRFGQQSEAQRKDLEQLQKLRNEQASNLEALSVQLAQSQSEREHLNHQSNHFREELERTQQQLYLHQEELEFYVLKLKALEELPQKNEESLQELEALRTLRDEQAGGIDLMWSELTESRRERERVLQENAFFREEMERSQQQLYLLQEELERSALIIKVSEEMGRQNQASRQELEALQILRDEQARIIEGLVTQLSESQREREHVLQERLQSREEMERNRQTIYQLQEELERSLLIIKAGEEVARQNEEYQQELELLRNLRVEQARNINDICSELTESRREQERVLHESAHLSDQIELNKKQICQLQQEVENGILIIRSGEEVARENQELRQELELLRKFRDEQIQSNDTLLSQLAESQREREHVLQERLQSREEMERNRQTIYQLQEELERSLLIIKAGEEVARQNEEYQQELELLRNLRVEQARNINDICSELTESRREQERVLHESAHLSDQIELNKKQICQLQQEVENGILIIRSGEEVARENQELRQELELLRKFRDEQITSNDTLLSQLAESQRERERVLQENVHFREEIDRHQQQIYHLQEDLEHRECLIQEGKELGQQHDEYRKQLELLWQVRLDQARSIEALSTQLAELQSERDRLLEENHNSAEDSEKLKQNLYRLQEELERYLLQSKASQDLAISQDVQLRRAQALLSRLAPESSIGNSSQVLQVDVLPPVATEYYEEGSVQMKALLSSYAKSLQRAKALLQRSTHPF